MSKQKRKRIILPIVESIIIDEKAFIQNSCSSNAKKIYVFDESLKIEIWVDKHYESRVYHGSDDGTEREGIGYDKIEPLIIKSFKHLLYYSLKHKNFVFINHPPNKVHNIRLVLKELLNVSEYLNVVVEYHFVDLKTIELTIVTALKKENYIMSVGQFGIKFDNGYSELIQQPAGAVEIIVDNYES